MTREDQGHGESRGKVTAAANLALGGVVILLVVQLAQGRPDGTTLILAAFAALLIFIRLAPGETSRFFRRMSNLKVAGVLEIGMQTVARAEVLEPPPVDDEDRVEERNGEGHLAIVAKLEDELGFVHPIVQMQDAPTPDRSERQIALWLGGEDLLTENEAQFTLDLLSGRDLGIDALPEREREELLDAAWDFAVGFRFKVWDRHVRRQLRKHGWVVADLPESKDSTDLLAYRDGRWALISTKVGWGGGIRYGATRKRLEKTEPVVDLAGWCILFPGGKLKASVVSMDGSGKESKVKVLALEHLLQEPDRAFQGNNWNDDYMRPCHPDQD